MATNSNVAEKKIKLTSSSKPIEITRIFKLPAGKVWKAWTDPEAFKKWWGPEHYTCPACSIDLRVGGKYLACMRSPEGKDYWSTGTYQEIVPGKKLALTDNFSDEKGNVVSASSLGMPGEWPDELDITIELEEKDGNTKMRLRHIGIPAEMYDDCITGWQQSFDKLEKNIH